MHHRTRTAALIAAFLSMVALLISSCSSSGGTTKATTGGSHSGSQKTLTVGVIFPDTQGFYAGVLRGIQLGAKSAGRPVKIDQTNTGDDASKEAQFMQTLVAAHVGVILTSPTSDKASVPAIKSAGAAGVPIVCYNTCINTTDLDKYVAAYANGDATTFGHMLGAQAVKYFQSKGITAPKIGVLNCEFVLECIQRRAGFEAALKASLPNYKIVANQQATDSNVSAGIAKNMLIANPGIDALFGESGGATTGAITGVQETNRTGKTVVFGADMTTQIAQALKQNTILKAEVDVSGTATGKAAIATAIAVLNGKKFANKQVDVPIVLYSSPADASAWLKAHADGIP